MARFTMRWLRGFEAHRRSIAGAEILTKLALYYVHERAWAIVPYGLRPNE